MGISQMLIRDLEKLMSRGALKESGAAGEVMPGADVKLETQKVSERFDAFVEEKIQWTKDFERELGMLVDMLSKLMTLHWKSAQTFRCLPMWKKQMRLLRHLRRR